jgi:hypothetical protein
MPYLNTGKDVPKNVRRVSARRQHAWRATWDAVYQKTGDKKQAYMIANGNLKSGKNNSRRNSARLQRLKRKRFKLGQGSELVERGLLIKARLTSKTRKKLPKGAFAVPERRAYPIHDKAHGRAALAYVSRFGSPSEKKRVRAAVRAKFGYGKTRKAYDTGLITNIARKFKSRPKPVAGVQKMSALQSVIEKLTAASSAPAGAPVININFKSPPAAAQQQAEPPKPNPRLLSQVRSRVKATDQEATKLRNKTTGLPPRQLASLRRRIATLNRRGTKLRTALQSEPNLQL